ncbi:hypothetical protein L211DRAFT_820970 [Terfezia boudieri ATCC MYA-4762]|uniref:Tse2 ADP-ribosyltransferase toxin domain-containing protein n=1 Tax=Terfezia boudieri ATCC MYA-4762 TaxID=1051890 RepID=A0A3N4LY59_9PEZI|nr:hypothetical protein L211DRAFT_820970 [Terfezia boudieri ATCC MYA-4762]
MSSIIGRTFTTIVRGPLLGRYTIVPVDLFRISAKPQIVLRDFDSQNASGRTSYDLHLGPDGLVHPKPGPNWEGPNGASIRPNGPMLQEIIRNFKGKNTTVYRLPEGTNLPEQLILLHEHSDHYSLQTTEPVELKELNHRLTNLLQSKGERMTQKEFCDRYPF